MKFFAGPTDANGGHEVYCQEPEYTLATYCHRPRPEGADYEPNGFDVNDLRLVEMMPPALPIVGKKSQEVLLVVLHAKNAVRQARIVTLKAVAEYNLKTATSTQGVSKRLGLVASELMVETIDEDPLLIGQYPELRQFREVNAAMRQAFETEASPLQQEIDAWLFPRYREALSALA
jgi:hypothetical protein